ncbi:glutathione S-transferase family protein [Jannaschia sp. M317]|uniref:glutathione S-transferase family protein n=1 Tax=Jannaschia sp. M317 TaxID=2867011 RepID=UPI0021A71AE2|nr:glutathione S-transferase family protein [Jannaschia sp. M317]UWQ16199.1 glutathione S-transferase family protein [Jannaschia sp. M317]
MPTLFHAPNSRSTSILVLLEEMGVADQIDVVEVSVIRNDGSGAPDPRNPHPEGKVPYLVDGTDRVRERGAIVAYLTDMFPDTGLGRPVGHPQRGAFLSWLFYYQGVMEPVLVLDWAKIDHPAVTGTFRTLDTVFARLSETLDAQPYLLGDDYSAVDLLLSSPFQWIPDAVPDQPSVRAWIDRCANRPALKAIVQKELAQATAVTSA